MWAERARQAAPSGLPTSRFTVRALLAESISGVLQRPVRSALTMLGTVLGIGSFVAILGLSATASGQISQDFSLLDATQVTVTQNPPPVTASMPFPPDTSTRLGAINGVVASGTWWALTFQAAPAVTAGPARGTGAHPQIFAATPGALRAAEVEVGTGRAYDEFAETSAARVALISQAVARQVGITDVAQGPAIFIGDDTYTVVGILTGARRLPQLLSGIVIPAATAQARYGDPDSAAPAQVLIRTQIGAAQTVADQAPVALRPDAPGILAAQAPLAPDRLRAAVTGRVDSLVLALAVVTLVIGAVGIANTTLVAVVERTGEIGLRRALGAQPAHIARQFLTEAALLGGLGGILGTALALATILVVSLTQRWTPLIDPATVWLAPLAGVVIGVAAGTYPALRASRITPVEALQR